MTSQLGQLGIGCQSYPIKRNADRQTSDTKSQFPHDKTKKTPPTKTKLDTQLPKLENHSILLLLSRILNFPQHRFSSPEIPHLPAKSSPPIKNVTSETTQRKKLGWMSSNKNPQSFSLSTDRKDNKNTSKGSMGRDWRPTQ
ncbi:hypothetical protein CEXT_86211 [Caerostris extrusa]|uniref:Uncharacterized protein n=1 Tax=Caerostris extrusa TaxID=172846 RepID=A0AAV4WRA3_CAEEX|nr:hypothetical protein CEXT_86211 [Caerostris extrusa]